jgi:hypothetical protein
MHAVAYLKAQFWHLPNLLSVVRLVLKFTKDSEN